VIKVSLKEAEGRLGHLMQAAAAGEEVVIASVADQAVRKILLDEIP
jgi:antitoxin (DNA-binding transcriptional repressor) of toxin-antitoxin stability system